ncbi:glycoside hydrolase family 10 protein [Paenibacillus mendelii]|uniref:Glycoside hydrolase family 10 protein n=1 Tax=Paenibacillus mendelii TaxID=206163 RepID=A0ABV6JAW4_9BACL|nr:family 10 glycosylhydrolase [Paenibacillus mendelii]MCQ6562895.1 family 10 glycosylhydrolase [Paenibacillus mendelii]
MKVNAKPLLSCILSMALLFTAIASSVSAEPQIEEPLIVNTQELPSDDSEAVDNQDQQLPENNESESQIEDPAQGVPESEDDPGDTALLATEPQLIIEGKDPIQVDLIDQERTPNSLAVYTRNYGSATKPYHADDTAEYIVVNGVIAVIAADRPTGGSGTNIPLNGYVISASGTAKDLLTGVKLGQSVQAESMEIPVYPNKYFKVSGVVVGITGTNKQRLSEEVILFTPEYGESTIQNPWGMELTVVDGKVTRFVSIHADESGNFVDNDSPIPDNGYVLSIQSGNKGYDELLNIVQVGDEVELDMDSPVYQAAKTSFDARNADRLGDQMIVYDRGGERTGTNGWGSEVVVDKNGFVVTNGGNDSLIPEGGLVLSGHGVKNAWLTSNAPVGARVWVDDTTKQVLIIFTPESYLDKAAINILAAENQLEQSKKEFRDVPYTEIQAKIDKGRQLYEEAEARLAAEGIGSILELLKEIDSTLTDALYMTFESGKVETRGVWLRPKETNLEDVKKKLNNLKSINVNAVYLETWWDGYTTWPTEIRDSEGLLLTELNPLYQGFDVLDAYIKEGKKLGIEIHAWVENFFAGGPSVMNHPEWRLTSRDGTDYEPGPNNTPWYWLNPALPETRDFVSDVYEELLTKYDVASLHLDYARYPGSGDYSNDFGYDEFTRGEFMKKYNTDIDPIDLHPGDVVNEELWNQWLQFRADIINTWVERVVEEAHAIKSDLQITASIWPNFHEAPMSHAQETKYWLDHNLIDELFHMSYASGSSVVVGDLLNSLELAKSNALVSSGIDTFQGNPTSAVLDQVKETIANGAIGTALFEYEGIFNFKYEHALRSSVYRNEAIKPDYRYTKPLAAVFTEMIRRINDIYVPMGGLNDKNADKLRKDLQSAIKHLKSETNMSWKLATKAKKNIDQINSRIASSAYGTNDEVKKRLAHDLSIASQMVEVFIAKDTTKPGSKAKSGQTDLNNG